MNTEDENKDIEDTKADIEWRKQQIAVFQQMLKEEEHALALNEALLRCLEHPTEEIPI